MAKAIKIDNTDRKILRILQENAKITNAQLSKDIGLSPAPTLERVKKLENMGLIKTLVAMAPMLGLLGTVTGMIEVFHVMAVTGGGDPKLMAGGVSRATVPTMAGMVAALSGVFAQAYLTRIVERESALLEDHLTSS